MRAGSYAYAGGGCGGMPGLLVQPVRGPQPVVMLAAFARHDGTGPVGRSDQLGYARTALSGPPPLFTARPTPQPKQSKLEKSRCNQEHRAQSATEATRTRGERRQGQAAHPNSAAGAPEADCGAKGGQALSFACRHRSIAVTAVALSMMSA